MTCYGVEGKAGGWFAPCLGKRLHEKREPCRNGLRQLAAKIVPPCANYELRSGEMIGIMLAALVGA
jgi:hypothetical protein